jgi:hypothetical protein
MQQKFSRSMFRLMVVLVMVAMLALVGCSDDDDGDGDFVEATPADLENLAFAFTDCGAFDPGLDGDPCVVSFGNFIDNPDDPDTGLGTFTLTSGGSTAEGAVTVGSCEYDVTESNFAEGTGPQVGNQFTHDPCEIDEVTGAYRGENEATGDVATSAAPVTGTGGGGGS